MASQPVEAQGPIRFGDFELDVRVRRLRRRNHVVKLERIPLEILVLLVENRGEIVTRDQVASRVWGNGVFFDTDNSIRGAIRKVRQALKDDPENPRFIQTITGRGYRFIAAVIDAEASRLAVSPVAEENGRRADTPVRAEADQGPKTSRTARWLVMGSSGRICATCRRLHRVFAAPK